MSDYKVIWKHFLEFEAKDFEEERKLSTKEIKKVGIKKFILANGWDTIEDTRSWRTDVYDVIPCPGCHKDFGILDSRLGLCDKCYEKFDMRKFYEDVKKFTTREDGSEDPELVGKFFALFLGSKAIRNQYLNK